VIIALVNELKVIYGAMGIDIEVIDAAKTSRSAHAVLSGPPRRALHPDRSFFLSWQQGNEINTLFIELAGEINIRCRARRRAVAEALGQRANRA